MKVLLSLIFCLSSIHLAFGQSLTGPVTVTAGQNGTTYSFNNGIVYSSFTWYLSNGNGIVATTSRSGTTHSCTIDWKIAGPTTLTFSAYGSTKGTLNISVNCPTVSMPTVTFAYPNGTSACGSVSITYTASPPTGLTWYWQTSSGGTSTANSTKSFTATTSGTYYLRAKCLNTWGTAKATSAVTVKTIPTVAASDVAICSSTATNLTLTNNVPSTNTWTVSMSNATGASNGSAFSSSSPPYVYTLNQTLSALANTNGTATYTITPTASGCTGTAITKTATVKPVPSAAVTSGAPVCSGATVPISLTTNGVSGATYTWSVAQVNVTGATTPGSSATSTNQTLSNTGNVPGTASYSIVPAAYGCTGSTVNAVINVNPNPTITLSNLSPTFCAGSSTNISFSSAVSGTTFTWSTAPSNVTGAQAQTSPISSGTISQGLSSQDGITPGSVTYNLQSSATFSNGGSCSSTGAATVTVKPRPVAAAASRTFFDGSSVSLLLSSNIGGSTFSYVVLAATNVAGFSSGTSNPLAQPLSLTNAANPGSVTYTVTPTLDGCTGSPANAIVSLYPEPIITPSTSTVYMGSTAMLIAQPFYDTYNWSVPSGQLAGTSSSISISKAQTYFLTVVKDGITSPNPVSVTIGGQFNGQNLNYILSNSLQVATSDTSKIKLLPVDSLQQSIQYFDGIGRPIQSVITQGSPSKLDIVQPVTYDAYGRKSRNYLPFAYSDNGWYKEDPVGDISGYTTSEQYSFYNNGVLDKIVDDTRPFNETSFESSDNHHRRVREYGPGIEWGPTGDNRYIQYSYRLNANGTTTDEEQIIAWKIDPTTNLPVRDMTSNEFLSAGYYKDGQLRIKSTKDEDGTEVREYTDRSGRVILKKVQSALVPILNNEDHWAQTYYIYDDLGLLRIVLQPELSKTLHSSGTLNPTTIQLNAYCFQYTYDGRNRLIQKQVPGAKPVYMIYDNRDRLVLTQDGNQRAVSPTKEWTFTKYDVLNRPVLTGKYSSNNNRDAMQTAVNTFYSSANPQNWYEQEGTAVHGYTNQSFPSVTVAGDYFSVTYYDNYNFRDNLAGANYNYVSGDLTGQPTSYFTEVIGQITGTKTRVLETSDFLWNVIYCDDRYRPIQVNKQNHKGGIDRMTTAYDFAGKIIKTKSTHSSAQMASLVTLDRNEYDHAGRMKKQYHTISEISNPVVWIDKVAATQNGDQLVKTGATAGYNAGARTENVLDEGQDGWIEVSVQNNYRALFGLTDNDVDADYYGIDYGMYLSPGWELTVYENSVNKGSYGTYAVGDIIRVERINGVVHYKKNGITLYSSLTPSITTLFGDASLYNAGDKITSARMSVGVEYLLVAHTYNELGQLVDKTLTAADDNYVQSLDYRYNIRGWLTSINNAQLTKHSSTNDEVNDLFGMELLYNTTDPDLGNTGMFNGNISAVKWKNAVAGTPELEDRQGYKFDYDPMNRLTNAQYAGYRPTTGWEHEANAFNEVLSYDLNGNIESLQRNKLKAGLAPFSAVSDAMDDLAYTYTNGNQLNQVEDAAQNEKGFKNGATHENEYQYDANGSMVKDLNKGIDTIAYNHLNLPSLITFSNGNTIQYIYDAAGTKLKQTVTEGSNTKVTDYLGSIVYERDTLRFFSMPDGRVVKNDSTFEYQFMLKDHLGNTRVLYGNPFEGSNIVGNGDCKTLDYFLTAQNVTRSAVTINGQSYLKYVSNQTTSTPGMFTLPINVKPGERYTYKVKGYRANNPGSPAYLYVYTSNGNLIWPGTNLPYGQENENWVFNDFTVPEGVTTVRLGVFWTADEGLAIGDTFYLNEVALLKHHDDDHLAGFELSEQGSEAGQFANYHTGKINNSGAYSTTGSSAYRLTASTQISNEVIGPAKTMRVYPGDAVHMEVYGRYLSTTGGGTNVGGVIAGLLQNAFGLSPAGATDVAYQAIGNLFGAGPVIGALAYPFEDEVAPKAFLNYILFDEDYIPYDFGYDQIDNTASVTEGTPNKMSLLAEVRKSGYIYIYLSNENEVVQEVYFDDLAIKHVKGVAIQQSDYYPFGLTFNSYSRGNSIKNKFKFQGQEHIDDLNLGWDSFKWRNHQPDIGRFFNVDPLAEKYVHNSPYAFSENKVTSHVELEGLEAVKAPTPGEQSRRQKNAEISFLIAYPPTAIAIGQYSEGSNNISTIAANFSINATNNTTMTKGGERSDRNALRHGVWQAMITRDFGKDMAATAGYAHEGFTVPEVGITTQGYSTGAGKASEADSFADLLNNIIGQNIGENNPNATNVGLSLKVLEEFKENGMWTVQETKNGYSITKTKISQEQYEQGVQNVRPLRDNGLSRKKEEEDKK